MEALVRYDWLGNIRELQNVIERAVIISKGPALSIPVADLKSKVSTKAITKTSPAHHERLQDVLDETERSQILRALEEVNGAISGPNGAAARLGMKRSTLQFRMQKLGIRMSRTEAAG